MSCSFTMASTLHESPTLLFFFFNDTATTEIYTLSLHDALPICPPSELLITDRRTHPRIRAVGLPVRPGTPRAGVVDQLEDMAGHMDLARPDGEIGRASCRERV